MVRSRPAVGPRSTKDQILDVAEELVQTNGANGISFATISERVGIRKASIHHHFPTKDDLIKHLVRRYSQEFLAHVDKIIESKATAGVKLRNYAALFDHTLQAPPGQRVCLCGMLGAELGSLSPAASTMLRGFYRDNEQRLAHLLDQGRKDGSLRFEGDARTMGMSLFSFLEGAMIVARADRGTKQFRQLSERVLGLLEA